MCDTLVSIGDDGVVFAKNSDRDANEAQLLEWVPARDHLPGTVVRCTWIEIPQVERTHAVLLSRPWWMFGAEIGANSHGVVIGNEAVFTKELARRRRDGETAPGLLGMDMLRLALERATDASEAVQVIVTLLEAHGQVGGCSHERPGFTYDNSFIVADPDGAIVLETAGRSHATETVVSGGRSISNGLTIPGFAAAHADPLRGRVAACTARRSRTESAARSAARGTSGSDDEADPVGDLMAALRDHGPDGLPRWSLVNGALSAPCAHPAGILTSTQSTASWVADLRDRHDPVHWVTATSAPCTSTFKPVRVDEPVDLGPDPTDRFDPTTTWWRHEVLHRAALTDAQSLLPRFSSERDRTEEQWRRDPPGSVDAFTTADRLEARWATDVIRTAQPDRRSAFVRHWWRRRDAAAAMPTGSGNGSSRYRPALDLVSRERRLADTAAARRSDTPTERQEPTSTLHER